MPRRFFRKFGRKRKQISERWFMSPFRHLLHDHRLWSMRRRTVVPAFALGLFISFLPFPGHFMFAALCALMFHINIPVAALTTFIVNPLTMYPLFRFSYLVGARLLSVPPGQPRFEFSLDWITHTFVAIWKPMLLGGFIVGSVAALLGYVVVDALWRYSVGRYKSRKRNQRL
ncbi:MAG: DUF2062 domain-containing protein [Woeseiaceae bacterium]|jgi:uncharacterized protein